MSKKKKKKGWMIIAAIAFLVAIVGIYFYNNLFSENIKEDTVLFVEKNSTENDFKILIEPIVTDFSKFNKVAEYLSFYENIKPGKYELKEGMSSFEIISLLKSGRQTPINLTFNNQHTLESLAGRISTQIEADSISLLEAMNDREFLAKNGFTPETALSMYIPNSYQVYWTISLEEFREKMLKEYTTFWNQNRVSKAQKLNLSIEEVTILASIVQRETATIKERPIVAGLYLNRLKSGWPLQADPTVIFALKQLRGQDVVIKRVLKNDLVVNSPYNTYLHIGLPPGPISMPDISSIDAVLNPAQHKYFYMCASVEIIGIHVFAETLLEHTRNAIKYQKWMNKQGVKR